MKSERSFQLGRWLKQLCSSTTCISVMANVQSTLSVFLIYLNAWLTQQAHARKMTARDLNAGADKTPLSLLTGRQTERATSVGPGAESLSQRWRCSPSALGISAEPAGQYCRWDHTLLLAPSSWLVVGVREAWSGEGVFQLAAEVCFENASILRACNRLIEPLPSQGKALFIWSRSYHLTGSR